MESDAFPPADGFGDLTTDFLNGVEQRLAGLSPEQIDSAVAQIFCRDRHIAHRESRAPVNRDRRAACRST